MRLRTFVKVQLRVPDKRQVEILNWIGGSETLTPQMVSNRLAKLVGKVDNDDNLIIWFLGHGYRAERQDGTYYGEGYLALQGGDVSAADMQRDIERIGASLTILIADSCHSDHFTRYINPSNGDFAAIASSDKYGIVDDLGLHTTDTLLREYGRGIWFQQAFTNTLISLRNRGYKQIPVLRNPDNVNLHVNPWDDPTDFA
jgi:hypothetical protein